MLIHLARFLVCLLAGLQIAGCERPKRSVPAHDNPPPPAAEPWVTKPPTEWPQLVLTNSAQFRGHTALNGASSFLVQLPDHRIVAATALHLLGRNGGVEPTLEPERLKDVLSSWRMFPRTKPEKEITLSGPVYPLPQRQNLDWLLLLLSENSQNLPSTPLRLRREPVSVGEDVFLVGVPYSEPQRAQNVYRGRVTGRGDKGTFHRNRFRFTIDPPVDIRGFSGAPILDSRGLAVGLMTVWFDPKEQGGKSLEAGGEDSASVLDHLFKRP